jgi:hypothetical protein
VRWVCLAAWVIGGGPGIAVTRAIPPGAAFTDTSPVASHAHPTSAVDIRPTPTSDSPTSDWKTSNSKTSDSSGNYLTGSPSPAGQPASQPTGQPTGQPASRQFDLHASGTIVPVGQDPAFLAAMLDTNPLKSPSDRVVELHGSHPSIGTLNATHAAISPTLFTIQSEASSGTDQPTVRTHSELPNLPVNDCQSPSLLDDTQIATLARQNSTVKQLLTRESLAAGLTTSHSKRDDSVNSSARLYQRFLKTQAARQSDISAETALRAHYGIRSLNRTIELLHQILSEVDRQQATLAAAVVNGLPVGDLSILERVRLETLSQLSESSTRLATLRSQLSLLIGAERACCYQPSVVDGNLPPNDDLCRWIALSRTQRCDLVGYRMLQQSLTIENLDVARLASSQITGSAAISTNIGRRWLERILRRSDEMLERELTVRRRQIGEYANSLQDRIASDVEVAWLERGSAIDRWYLALQTVQSWTDRIEQLKTMESLGKPDASGLFTARLEYLQAQIDVVARWNDFYQSHIKMMAASGSL